MGLGERLEVGETLTSQVAPKRLREQCEIVVVIEQCLVLREHDTTCVRQQDAPIRDAASAGACERDAPYPIA
jgi:hypothetical protein